MTDPNNLEPRLVKIERDVASLREAVDQARGDAKAARVLASAADRDVAEVRAELRAHTGALNALRETQNDHYREHKTDIHELRAEMREGFARVDANFARVDAAFAVVHAGQAHITRLIEAIADR